MDARFYLTTAIFYPSPAPALHSMFEVIGADAVARYHRLLGEETRLLTGMDEHSANIERLAREMEREPRGLVDEWATVWRDTFDRYLISYDRFIRTTDPDHIEAAREMVSRADQAGDVYTDVYSGWFCIGCNEFKTEQQLVDGRCPDHPTLEPQWLEEENHFFRLSRYQEALEQLYRDNPSFCEPEHFRKEVLGWLREGLRDFSISRAGATWGIPFPGDEGHRIYVWFDALTNYLTGAGFPSKPDEFARFWPADVHIIGKNITRLHCLYWPAMLMSAGIDLPRQVFAHGFMLNRGERMSKTRGNVLDPVEMAELFGVDGIRFLVLREVPFDRDGDVTFDGFVRRYNAELANDLGNLVNRTVSMSRRYLDGKLPPLDGDRTDAEPEDARLNATAERAIAAYHDAMGRYQLDEALAQVMELTDAANRYVESQAPWTLHRAGQTERLGGVLAALGEVCRLLGHLMAPFTPVAARELHEQLGVPVQYDARGAGGPPLAELLRWGAAHAGWQTAEPRPLFPRVELDADGASDEAQAARAEGAPAS